MRKIVKEDLDLQPMGYKGFTIQELYDDVLGDNLFDEENIPLLKEAGLIDEDGYPIEEYENWNGEKAERKMSLKNISDMDIQFIKSPYIKQLALKEIYEYFSTKDENGNIIYKYTDKDLPKGISNMGEDFISALFSGDAWEFFDNWGDFSFSDTSYYFDDICDEVLDTLESYGFPRDIYNKLESGDADEDSPLAKYYDDLKWAITAAYGAGYEQGSAVAAMNDFDNAFAESVPEGCEWLSRESDDSKRPILTTKEFWENNLKEIWNLLGDYSNDIGDCAKDYLIESINLNLGDNFREPYYGWQEFDEEAFNDRLLDEILELDIPKQEEERAKQSGQMSLFDDEENNDNEEVHEDLDLQPVDFPFDLKYVNVYGDNDENEYVDFIIGHLEEDCWQLTSYAGSSIEDVANGNFYEIYDKFVNYKFSDDETAVGIAYVNDVQVICVYALLIRYKDDEEIQEDLDLVPMNKLQKPNKLFYKYKEYNKELSSKAYRLDFVRYNALMDFLRNNNHNHRYVDEWYMKDLEAYEEYENAMGEDCYQYIILSKVKPSYAKTLAQSAYTIWEDNGDYETNYKGWIPASVAEEILRYGDVREDLQIDVIPVPDIEIKPVGGHSAKEIEDILARFADDDCWFFMTFNGYDWDVASDERELQNVYAEYENYDVGEAGGAEIICCVDIDTAQKDNLDLTYVVCRKLGPRFEW